jgi:hypothetical protein
LAARLIPISFVPWRPVAAGLLIVVVALVPGRLVRVRLVTLVARAGVAVRIRALVPFRDISSRLVAAAVVAIKLVAVRLARNSMLA